MDTAWRFRLVLIMTFAIIIFGDMLGYANVKGDKDSNGNQRSVGATLEKNHHTHSSPRNIEGTLLILFLTNGHSSVIVWWCFHTLYIGSSTSLSNKIIDMNLNFLHFTYKSISDNLFEFEPMTWTFSFYGIAFNLNSVLITSKQKVNNLVKSILTILRVIDFHLTALNVSFEWCTRKYLESMFPYISKRIRYCSSIFELNHLFFFHC